MPPRLPTANDFPSSITLTITPPPPSHPPTNVLILLHGLGDSIGPFTSLGRQLNLPETACIAIQAPKPLPFDLPGFHWGDDLEFDEATGEMDFDTGFKGASTLVLDEVIRHGLLAKCGYRPRDISLFGLGQGGMVALRVAAELQGPEEELGGVVSIGGPLPGDAPLQPAGTKNRTPVMLCKGDRGSKVTDSNVSRLRGAFEFVEVVEWRRKGDAMPSNREEMLPIMKFWARRLRSVRGVPEGAVELR